MKLDKVLWDQRIKIRDGTEISSDIYGIESGKRKPAIVFRTPYGKSSDNIVNVARYFSSKGYIFISCDVRGRGDSDGKFVPYENEGKDGFDVLKWVSRQKWCDGRTATWGASYAARIQWYTAILKPKSLVAMISIVTPSDPFVENPTGLPSPLDLSWEFSTSGRSLQNINPINWQSIYSHLPMMDMSDLTGRKMEHWKERLKHQIIDEYIRSISYQNAIERVAVPVLHISGWYDDEQIGTPLNFQSLSMNDNADVSSNQFLLMGPWGHNVNSSRTMGEFNFGPAGIIDLLEYERSWLDCYFLQNSRKNPELSRVRLFLMGRNKWMNFTHWPPENTQIRKWYLSSKGPSNSRFGNGKLSTDSPDYEMMFDTYIYNPENPVPFIAEQGHAQIGGPDDYSAIERRDDVLVYTTERLSKAISVIGPVSVTLFVSTSASDTDFTGKLLVVTEDNKSVRLCDGIFRMRYREGFNRIVATRPGDLYEIHLNLWNTAYQFRKGEKIRLEVSSSAFPKYARNLNLFVDQSNSKKWISAVQRIYHGLKTPSYLSMNVLT